MFWTIVCAILFVCWGIPLILMIIVGAFSLMVFIIDKVFSQNIPKFPVLKRLKKDKELLGIIIFAFLVLFAMCF